METLKLEDIKINRDENGDVIPFTVPVLQYPTFITMRPINYGISKDLPEDKVSLWDPKDQIKLVHATVIEPDFSSIKTADDLVDFDRFLWEQILVTITLYSGPLRKIAYDSQEDLKKGEIPKTIKDLTEISSEND